MTDSTINPPVKRCTKCGTAKALEEFNRNRARADGHNSECRDCRRVRYQANAESIRARSQAWREANREKDRETSRQRREANRERNREYARNWREANPEKKHETDRQWREANREKARDYQQNNLNKRRESDQRRRTQNPEKFRAKVHKRRALLASVGGRGVTAPDMKAMIYIQQGLCAYCERDGQKLTLDHIIPIEQNGPHDIDNACMCCGVCNSSKGARTPEQWIHRWYLR